MRTMRTARGVWVSTPRDPAALGAQERIQNKCIAYMVRQAAPTGWHQSKHWTACRQLSKFPRLIVCLSAFVLGKKNRRPFIVPPPLLFFPCLSLLVLVWDCVRLWAPPDPMSGGRNLVRRQVLQTPPAQLVSSGALAGSFGVSGGGLRRRETCSNQRSTEQHRAAPSAQPTGEREEGKEKSAPRAGRWVSWLGLSRFRVRGMTGRVLSWLSSLFY
ncbi:hypothetical protein B0H67DRAFT_566208 [Lasiosphaeris hirsuta]|uniref:Uncharacterized protein n=1 Tax=Lasiosphaeris hirsuta TaxID=260670 RepID=A0AA40BCW3_9PEZI|nr:hypothetical protein B0H67DRAFT_566208 [Lasiosphaeris hirsuta]